MLNEEKLIEALRKIDNIIRELLDVIDPKPGVITYNKTPEEKVITYTDYIHREPVEHPCETCGNEIEDWVHWKKLCKKCYAQSKQGGNN